MLDQITPLILTFNEAPNIGRSLERLSWARDVVVVDSFSTDETLAIVNRFANTRVFQREFDDHAQQWQFGLGNTGIQTGWVLALDADYILTDEFLGEIQTLSPVSDVSGYKVRFDYWVEGHPLRAAVYPPVTVLYRRTAAVYVQDGHTQRVQLTGRILELKNHIRHDDRKPLRNWLRSQSHYMQLEADKLRKARFSAIPIQDRARKLVVIAPVSMFFYCMFVKGNVLDGRPGLLYALQRTVAEGILSLYLLEALLSADRDAK